MNKKSNILFLFLVSLIIVLVFFFGLFVSYFQNQDTEYINNDLERIKEIIIDNPTYEF